MKWPQKIREMGFSWGELLGIAIVLGGVLVGIIACLIALVIGSLIPVWITFVIVSVTILWGTTVMLWSSLRSHRSSRAA